MVRVIETATDKARAAVPSGMSRMPGSVAAPDGKTRGGWPRSKRLSGIAHRGRKNPASLHTGSNRVRRRYDGPIVMLPRSELAVIAWGDAAFLGTVTVLVPT